MNRNISLLISLSLFLLFGGILIWFLWGNRGEVKVSGVPGSFLLSVSEFGKFSCPQSECIFRLPFGERTLCLETQGYKKICTDIRIPWKNQTNWKPQLERLPHVKTLESTTETKTAEVINANDQPTFIFNTEGKLIRKENESYETITVFHDLKKPQLEVLADLVFVKSGNEVFLVDTVVKTKKRIYTGTLPQIRKLSDHQLLIEDGDILAYFDVQSCKETVCTAQPLAFSVPARQVAACHPNILYFAKEVDQVYQFFAYNLLSSTETAITTARVGDNVQLTISCTAEDTQAVILEIPDRERQVLFF